ncbi:hypothetical protein Plhal304r1_c018g0063501 [Plasmopara halstedii]
MAGLNVVQNSMSLQDQQDRLYNQYLQIKHGSKQFGTRTGIVSVKADKREDEVGTVVKVRRLFYAKPKRLSDAAYEHRS